MAGSRIPYIPNTNFKIILHISINSAEKNKYSSGNPRSNQQVHFIIEYSFTCKIGATFSYRFHKISLVEVPLNFQNFQWIGQALLHLRARHLYSNYGFYTKMTFKRKESWYLPITAYEQPCSSIKIGTN